MGAFDPVPWDEVEATVGPPAAEITTIIEKRGEDVADLPPYDAVKTLHDALDHSDLERSVSSGGEPFITAYLLERENLIDPDGEQTAYRSLVERRPDESWLREQFWERERTLWWIGVLCGVHHSLVTFWCFEYDIPLMERNYTKESLSRIKTESPND